MRLSPPTPPLVPPVSERDHVIGTPDAPLQLVEYGDYQCPHCRKAHGIVQKIVAARGPGLMFAWRHFPLAKIHPQARLAAQAAEAAAAQGKFWEMHNAIFAGEALDLDRLVAAAESLGLDGARLRTDVEAGTYAPRVQEDLSSGVRSGVNATPTFYVQGVRHNGAYEYDALMEALDAANAQA